MSRVFTYEEISNRRIPTKEQIANFVHKPHGQLGRCSAVVAGVLYGSVVRREHNRGSDIDVLLVYQDGQMETLLESLGPLKQEANNLNIPLHVGIYENSFFQTVFCEVFPLFRAFIQTSEDIIKIKEHINTLLPSHSRPCQYDLEKDLLSYVEKKYRNINDRIADIPFLDEKDLCSFLQDILELPYHIARKVLYVDFDIDMDMTKSKTSEVFLAKMNNGTHKPFSDLVECDCLYQSKLEKYIACGIDKNNWYVEQISLLLNYSPAALKLLESIAMRNT